MEKIALAIHDLSCYAKSSLTVVLPVLEALGVECAVLPTAVLSTQTDGFENLYFEDKTDAMREIARKHIDLGIGFDGIYSGFLGSVEQIEIVESLMDSYNVFSLVDPVLGDNGMLYSTMTDAHVEEMRKLVKRADVITPNYTEAGLLTGMKLGSYMTNQDIEHLVSELRKLGPSSGVITSIPLSVGGLCNVSYTEDELRLFYYDDLEVSIPGSGDLFASLVFSFLLMKHSLFVSTKMATEICFEAIEYAKKTGRERRRGISLNPVMESLRRRYL